MRALIAAYEAIRSVEEDLAAKTRQRDAEYEEWVRQRRERERKEGEGG